MSKSELIIIALCSFRFKIFSCVCVSFLAFVCLLLRYCCMFVHFHLSLSLSFFVWLGFRLLTAYALCVFCPLKMPQMQPVCMCETSKLRDANNKYSFAEQETYRANVRSEKRREREEGKIQARKMSWVEISIRFIYFQHFGVPQPNV